MDEKTIARFWSKVDKRGADECWRWMSSLNVTGYGEFFLNGRAQRATRLVLAEKLRRPLLPGECALHKCDNPACVNPDHLFVGTALDNVRDMFRKGRNPKPRSLPGSLCGKAILTEAKVLEIRELLAQGESKRRVAKKYSVSRSAISDIKARRTWKHI